MRENMRRRESHALHDRVPPASARWRISTRPEDPTIRVEKHPSTIRAGLSDTRPAIVALVFFSCGNIPAVTRARTLNVCARTLSLCIIAASVRFAHLDNKLKVPLVIVEGSGGVRAHDLLAVDLSLNGNVLADGEAERVGLLGQAKAVAKVVSAHCFCMHGDGWQVRQLVVWTVVWTVEVVGRNGSAGGDDK